MKVSNKPIVIAWGGICLILILFVICGFAFSHGNVADAAGLYSLLTPKIVTFYEQEIAKEAVLSDKSDDNLRAVAARYGIEVDKAKCAIVLFDLANRTGGGVTFPEIARMSEFKMLAFARQRGMIFSQNLPQQERDRLKQRASELLGIRL